MSPAEILEVALAVPAVAAGAWGAAKTFTMLRYQQPPSQPNGNGKGYLEAKDAGKAQQILEDILNVQRQTLAAMHNIATSEVRIVAAVERVGDKIDQHDSAVREHVREAMSVVRESGITVKRKGAAR